jgi:uncharacterized membrane protein SirB2
MYEALKWVHVGCVIASGAGFVARGALMLVDTALLASAIAMAIVAHVSPLAHPWLAAKIVALLAYIALGALALRPGHSRPVRTVAFVAAALVFAYIVGTALNRDPLSWLARAV